MFKFNKKKHSDYDIQFQEKCLLEMLDEWVLGEVESRNIAYLIDRIKINKGHAQVFGTQFTTVNEGDSVKIVPKEIQDSKLVDKYRILMGMPTLKHYIHNSEKFINKQNK